MRTFQLCRTVRVRQDLEKVFLFFSQASNLEILTPPWLHFRVLTPQPIEMRAGTLIDYRLRVRGLGLRWQSEIAEWDPPRRFVDVQRKGPYRQWVHTHSFEGDREDTLVSDHVRYSVWGGRVVNSLFVARDLEKIFTYREDRLRELFPGSATEGAS